MSETGKTDNIELLIRLILQCPLIYNKASKLYKDMTKKKEAWEHIAATLRLERGIETSGM